VVSPYDAELYGHWWFEGPDFLNFLFRKLHHDQDVIKPITGPEFLERHPECEVAQPPFCTWGAKGYAEVWLNPGNDWIYPHLEMAAERMVELARRFREPNGLQRRALDQAARELLLAQASDWAFIMKTNTMVEYAKKRTRDHVARFTYLYRALVGEVMPMSRSCWSSKSATTSFQIDYRVYTKERAPWPAAGQARQKADPQIRGGRDGTRHCRGIAMRSRHLGAVRCPPVPGRLVGLISPHAGLYYSGPVAAHGYSLLRGRAGLSVVLVGPSHRVAFEGLALAARGAFETPLGQTPIDELLASELLAADSHIVNAPRPHRDEHSLEMQLPFLQHLVRELRIVPILMGEQTREEVDALAAALSKVLPGRDVLLVATTTRRRWRTGWTRWW
jgi:hypothetical protein